jgi:hypothetical protein
VTDSDFHANIRRATLSAGLIDGLTIHVVGERERERERERGGGVIFCKELKKKAEMMIRVGKRAFSTAR